MKRHSDYHSVMSEGMFLADTPLLLLQGKKLDLPKQQRRRQRSHTTDSPSGQSKLRPTAVQKYLWPSSSPRAPRAKASHT